MKMRNRSRLLRCLAVPFLAAALFCSCTEELSSEAVPGGGGGKTGESEVTLRLQVPGTATGRTRAITADKESKVDDLYILAFKVDPDNGSETFEYYVAAKQVTSTNVTTGQSTWAASLKVKEYEQTFVMVANAQTPDSKVNEQIAGLVQDKVGEDKMKVLEGLTETLSPDEIESGFNATSHPLTMYGQTQPVKIGPDNTAALTVALHRIVARVQVKFEGNAADALKFSAKEVYLYNFNDRARVIPFFLEETTDKDYVQTPTIPDDAELYPKTQDGTETVPTYEVKNNAVENTIYMFEAKQPGLPTDAENHLKRPCIIVKGEYEGKDCYYRVDFAKAGADGNVTYMDLVRNHSYNITVTNVSGRGSDSAHEALKNKAANITADVIEWNDNVIGNIDFDGDRVLGISTNSYELIKSGGIRLLQVRATANVTWTANLYGVKADGTADINGARPAWIYFTGEDGTANDGTTVADVPGTDALQDVYFKATVNEGAGAAAERKAIIRLTDDTGRLGVEALVVQNQVKIPVYLNVKKDAQEATEIEFMEQGGGILADIEFGPDDVTLSWEIVNGTNDGMDFNNVKMDNADVATDNMKGEITYDGNSPIHYLQVTVDELQSTKTWETRNAKLQLIAQQKSTGEMVVREIPLFQKKYGLEIDRTEIRCAGQEAIIFVKGNMPWSATWGDGFDNVENTGLLPLTKDLGSGRPSETGWVQASVIRLQTHAKPLNKEKYELDLIFTHRNGKVTLTPIQVTIQGGAIMSGGNIYDVYGPVERSINTKDEGYRDDTGQDIPGAVMANMWQAEAIFNADPGNCTWGICKDSEVKHWYQIKTTSQNYHVYEPNEQVEVPIILHQGTSFNVYERIAMSTRGPDVVDETLEHQELIQVYKNAGDPAHEAYMLSGTISGLLSITKIGYMSKSGTFYAYNKNVTWSHIGAISGDQTNAGVPFIVYGDAWSAKFKPNIRNSYVDKNQYELYITRHGQAGPLNADKWRNKPYKTFYVKPAD